MANDTDFEPQDYFCDGTGVFGDHHVCGKPYHDPI
jgi:hypothetical protein